MQRSTRESSLRRTLIRSALAVAAGASGAMVFVFSLVLAQREAVERDTTAFIGEQYIAESIVALTYRQQLAAMRFLEHGNEERVREFRALGDEAHGQIRQYLFHDLSNEARLQVERIKEAHQAFEVVAQRAFFLAQQGDVAQAAERGRDLDARTAALDSAVTRFIDARRAQRSALQMEHDGTTRQLRIVMGTVVALLFALALALVIYLRRRVLAPLRDLSATAARLGAGDFDARMVDQRYVEFNAVATAFNRMADSVQVARETMEGQNEEIRQSLDQLQQAQSELVQHEKLSAMGQMLAGLAHELNNPLAGILGMSELLRGELASSSDPALRQLGATLAEPLEREALRARALVHNLLTFARRPSGVIESVDLTICVSTALGMCAHAYSLAGKTIEVSIPAGLYVVAEMQKLQHAVVNIVNNALDSVIASGGKGIHISAEPHADDRVSVRFDDDGTGFADPVLALAPFYTTKAAGKGTGLGLSLVQQFVGEFEGMVTVENRATGGARVTLNLRRAEGSVSEREMPLAVHTPSALVTLPHGEPDTNGAEARPAKRVLVVDDEPALRLIQKRILARAGVDVLLAASGREACDILSREDVDLVISDLRMPGEMDGYALMTWLERERPALAATMLISTGDSSSVASRPLPVPPERILSKPFEAHEFLHRVQQSLGLSDR